MQEVLIIFCEDGPEYRSSSVVKHINPCAPDGPDPELPKKLGLEETIEHFLKLEWRLLSVAGYAANPNGSVVYMTRDRLK